MPEASSNIRRLPKYKPGDRVFVSLAAGARTGRVVNHAEGPSGLIAYTIKLEQDGTVVVASEHAVERILIVPEESQTKLPLATNGAKDSTRSAASPVIS